MIEVMPISVAVQFKKMPLTKTPHDDWLEVLVGDSAILTVTPHRDGGYAVFRNMLEDPLCECKTMGEVRHFCATLAHRVFEESALFLGIAERVARGLSLDLWDRFAIEALNRINRKDSR